jgi:hybrid cluster-associated redox disulfide protein
LRQRNDSTAGARYTDVMASPPGRQQWLALTVFDVLRRWPAAARLLLHRRMACVGCDFSRFDRLDEALAVHGLDPDEFLAGLAVLVDTDRQLAQGGAS